MRVNRFLGLFLAALLLAVSACGGSGDDGGGDAAGDKAGSGQADSGQEPQGDPSAPQPDLDGIPDVVAEVNGKELGKAEFVDTYTSQFQQMAMQSQSSGQDVDEDKLKKQVVDNMVNAELLVQEADNRNFDASQQRMDKTLQELAQQNGMKSKDEFIAALEQQGMERKEIESQLQKQVKVEQLLAADGGDAKPTEKELRALYEDMKAQQEQAGAQNGQKIPPFKQVRSQLEEQVKSQKESEVADVLIQELRKKADIKVHI